MAKQRIQNYVFLPGVSSNSNAYPNAYQLILSNKEFLKKEVVAYINAQITTDNASNLYPNAVTLLTNNRQFIIDEIIAWIANKVSTNTAPFVGYTYSVESCRRDTRLLVDAIIYDIRYGGNERTIDIAKTFWLGGTAQLISPTQEIAGFNQIFTIIKDYVLPKTAYTSQQSPVTSTQNVTGTAGEAGVTTLITGLQTIIINVIPNGLSVLPAVTYSVKTFAGYVYDSSRCDRDVGMVIDAYLHDLRYGGNAKTKYVASRFWNGSIPQISGDRKPEINGQTFIRDLINSTILLQPLSYTPYQTLESRVQNNLIPAEPNASTRITSLSTMFINVLTNGLSSLPVLTNGVSTIRLQGMYKLETLLLITNTSSNQILYNFSDSLVGGSVMIDSGYVSNDYYQDDDFPSYRNIADYTTTLILEADTSTANVSDDIQIFVEAKEQKIRPYDFGTDAIERMRVAQPQSMLDADFEYGLQPTKWQAIGISRGYPSVYEVPGTDTPVVNVVTDASTGTAGVGSSLITVTTTAPHGFTIGTPITIKALANSISGSSRAEGTFLINSVLSTTTFTYYAVSKVGTTNGNILATTYTQLRKGSFYTGASIGTPVISVFSNGAVSTFSTQFITLAGTDQISFTGTAPAIGAPLTGVGMSAGTQVSGVVGSGGITVSANVEVSSAIGDTSIVLTNTSGVLEGMAINNGSGTAIFVSSISGNTVNFTQPLTTARVGNTFTYVNVTGTNMAAAGSLATFNVSRVSNAYAVTLTDAGTGYRVGNRITILGTNVGGASPANDITITVATVDGITGAILTFTVTGTSISGDSAFTALSPDTSYTTGTYTNTLGSITSGAGSLASFNITANGTTYTAVFNARGSGYAINDTITINGDVIGGATPTNDLVLTVTSVVATYTGVTPSSTDSLIGLGAVFTISRINLTYFVTVTSTGSDYAIGEHITVLGSALGGSDSTNDITITVQSLNGTGVGTVSVSGTAAGTGGVNAVSVSGTAVPLPVLGTLATFNVVRTNSGYTTTINGFGQGYIANDTLIIYGDHLDGTTPANNITIIVGSVDVNGSITSITSLGNAVSGNATFGALPGTTIQPTGTLGTFDITRSAGSYLVVINDAGSNYFVGDQITVLGTSLGGSTTTNDATLAITEVNELNQIVTVTILGTSITGTAVAFYSAITISELTSANIPSTTTISAAPIAVIQISFTTNHGLVPGATISVDISSAGTNHLLAKGPYYVEQVPTLTTLRYTVRAAGTIDTGTTITGTVYTRSDSFFVHRPYDGGVMLGTGGPQHGAHAIRMSKKYIRYQSGKGINYCTGALFAPSFNIQSITATGVTIGSYITVTLDDVDHGCQVGGVIRISNVDTIGYNGTYTVADIVSERVFRVQATTVLMATTAVITTSAIMSVLKWHGATVRAGTFDDQNGIFFQYNGQEFAVGRRTATLQLAGVANITRDTNLVTGTNTRFRDQIKAGDRIVIKGMTHLVSNIISQTQMTINPDYRGAIHAVQTKLCLVQDVIVPQKYFNIDKLDGTGPSGFNIDLTKMQMIGMQWSWYAVGFIDFMLRGSDGNFVFFHRIRNSNVNTEAYMRTGNQAVRYEVINESASNKLASSITALQTTIPLVDASMFPNEAGTIYIDNELIEFSGKSGNSLTGCTRSAPQIVFTGGAQRTFIAGSAATHEYNTGVNLVSNTISPIISHWGSAMLTDGNFDTDRGYLFNYASTGISVSTTKVTAFLIRLAPSVSNAIVGDLGERELLNRAQLLLQTIEVTSDTGTGGIVVEGVLNPQNYPTDPANITWGGLSGLSQGGQPSFAQIAPGGSANWASGSTQTTATATTTAQLTSTLTLVPWANYGNGNNYFYVDATSWTTSGVVVGAGISDPTNNRIPAGATITSATNYTSYYLIYISVSITGNISQGATLNITLGGTLTNTNFLYFTRASWEALGAGVGQLVSDTKFPAGARVQAVSAVLTFGATQYYRVNFTQNSNGAIAAAATVTFTFGQPPYALPGETVFSFISAPGTTSALDLSNLKELTNTTLGGRGTYPNGPDVLAINVYKVSGTAIPANIVLRWGEAQA
jgi:hypothetical protein